MQKKNKVHLRHKQRPQRSWIRVPGTWCTAVAGAGWCCTPKTAVGSHLDQWKLLSCLRGSLCNKLLKNGWIEAAPNRRLRCAATSATFSWLQLTDLPIQLRLVRDFLLSLLPVLRHFTSQFFRSPLWLPFAEIAPTSLALCQRARQTLQSVTSSAYFHVFLATKHSDSVQSARAPPASFLQENVSLFACPWWYPSVASPTCLEFCKALQDSGVVTHVALKTTPAPPRLYSGCNICRANGWGEKLLLSWKHTQLRTTSMY